MSLEELVELAGLIEEALMAHHVAGLNVGDHGEVQPVTDERLARTADYLAVWLTAQLPEDAGPQADAVRARLESAVDPLRRREVTASRTARHPRLGVRHA